MAGHGGLLVCCPTTGHSGPQEKVLEVPGAEETCRSSMAVGAPPGKGAISFLVWKRAAHPLALPTTGAASAQLVSLSLCEGSSLGALPIPQGCAMSSPGPFNLTLLSSHLASPHPTTCRPPGCDHLLPSLLPWAHLCLAQPLASWSQLTQAHTTAAVWPLPHGDRGPARADSQDPLVPPCPQPTPSGRANTREEPRLLAWSGQRLRAAPETGGE